ncbi:MAG: glycosyl hydrolase [Lentisphaerae bacterium RIFOXYA12_FULL_48_11]|nr:MAG: glycosyl hydrolase [Lentisphaerae bacterium RIFOXYA12_FULL_48_11]
MKNIVRNTVLVSILSTVIAITVSAAENPFIGNWALTIPGGGAGWLGITDNCGKLEGGILWGGGSVVPVASVKIEDSTLVVTRIHERKAKDAQGKEIKVKETETIRANIDGANMKLTTERDKGDGKVTGKADFVGKRIPPMPAAPDLAKIKFGDAVKLFNGKDLTGWKLVNPNSICGWSVEDCILINRPVQEEGKPHKNYGNLRTEGEFEDFNIVLELRVPKNGNSGVYLRGIYEVQVQDSFGKPLDSHNMGAVYSRIKPTENAEKPAGEWQTMDITLVDRHITVVLNGKKIIDNQPLLGCTGGALTSDEFKPGPIYLQGDHTGVDYRSIILKPVVK